LLTICPGTRRWKSGAPEVAQENSLPRIPLKALTIGRKFFMVRE
jgi:hypothetical protein